MSSTITHTGVGQVSNTNGLGYSFSFATLNREDIQVEVIDPSNVRSAKTVYTSGSGDYTIENYVAAGSSNAHIKFVSETARGFTNSQTTYKVRISRQTPSTPKVNFTAGSSITASDLNTQGKQAFHLSEENRDSINALALGDSSSAIQIDSSNIKDLTIKAIDIEEKAVETDKINDLAVTTGKIADLAVTDAKIASTGIAGTKISPDFGSQDITTTGSLHVVNKLLTFNEGVRFSGTDYGFGVEPNLTSNPGQKGIFIAIGDNDTGICHDGDGQLEIWSDDQEIANFSAANGITTDKNIVTTSNVTAHHAAFGGELFMGKQGTADESKVLDVQIGASGSFLIRRTDGGDNHTPERVIAGFSYSQDAGSTVPNGKITAGSFVGDGSGLTNLNVPIPAVPLSKVASVIQSGDFTLPDGSNAFFTAGNGNMTRTVTAQSNDTYIWVQYKLMFSTDGHTANSYNRAIYKISLYKNGVFNQDILPESYQTVTASSFVTTSATFKFIPTSFSTNDSIEVRVLHRSYSPGTSNRGVFKSGSYLNVFCVDTN